VVFSIVISGCSKLTHLQQLLTIDAYSKNKDVQAAVVEAQNEKFVKLLEVVENNVIGEYPDQESFLLEFGEPIFAKKMQYKGQQVDKWMYRYADRLTNSEKVYLYFSQSGNLVDWKYYNPEVSDGQD